MGEGLSYRPHGSNIDSNEVGEDFPLPVQIRNSSGTELGTNANPIKVQDVAGNTDAVTVADGADVGEGATTDAAVTTDANGTLSAKLRGIVKLLAACLPAALGQALMAASTPVVVASDQSAVASKVADGQNVALGTTTDAAVTGNGSLLGIAKRIRDLLSLGASPGSIACELNAGGNYTIAWNNPTVADADANAAITLQAKALGDLRHYVRPGLYNGATYDRQRNNVSVTMLASGSRTTTTNGPDTTSYNGRRLVLIVDVSDASGGGSITPKLQVKDSVSGNYFTVWTAAAALTANGTYAYLFADGASGGSWTEKLAFGVPGRTFRVVYTANNASAIVYSSSCELMT